MRPINPATLEPMRQEIQEVVVRLDMALSEASNEPRVQDGLDLIMGDLTMVALLLTNIDLKVSTEELDLINGIRVAIYGSGAQVLSSQEYEILCKQFLNLYPEKHLTLDTLPRSFNYLLAYDQAHGTEYVEKARNLFIRFAEAIVRADQNVDLVEPLVLSNFKEVLFTLSSAE